MKRFLVAALSVSALALLAQPAMGGESIATEVVIRDNAPAFHGKVTAALDDCVDNRLVRLYRKVPNRPKKLLGSDTANSNGRWKVLEDQFTLKSGAYFAIAPQLGPCEKGKSDKVVVD